MNIANISIKQPVFVTMMMAVLVVIGYFGYNKLSVDLFPETSNPSVSVSTTYSGAGPSEIQRQVTQPIEDALSTLPGVTNIRSTSRENNSQISVDFTLETDPKAAFDIVRERVARTQNSLPSGANQPTVQRFDFSSQSVLTFNISDKSGKMKSYELRTLVEDQLQPRVERIDGVADVSVSGGGRREIQVNLNLDDLRSHRLSLSQVSSAIRGENLSVPGGKITQDGTDLLLRVPGEFTSLDDIRNLTIVTSRGTPLRIKDIATVQDTTAEVTSYSRLNGKDSVAVQVRKQSGTNTVQVAERVRAEVQRMQREFRDLDIAISNDQSSFIKKSIEDSTMDLIYGAGFASLIVLLFFRNFLNTFVTIAGLPVIMIGTFAAMSALNLSLNMMTLLALSLAVGLVLDDAIVVRENIFRHMERGETPKEAASRGTNEVSLSVVAMTLTIVSVFFPIAFTTGQIGRFYREFGLAVTAAVLISLFEAFTLAPMLSAYLFRQRKPKSSEELEEHSTKLGWLDRSYRRLLAWTLDHRVVIFIVTLAILGGLYVIVPSVMARVSFIPRIDNANFQVGLALSPGTTLAVTNEQAKQIEAALLTVEGIDNVFANIGGGSSPERANFNVQMKDLGALKTVEAEVRQKLAGMKGVSFNFQGGFGGGGTNVGSRPIQINLLSGGSPDELDLVAQDVIKGMAGIPGLADIDRSNEPGKPELRIMVDRNRASQYNLTTSGLGTTIRSLVSGDTASRYREPGKEADIIVRLRPEDRSRLDDIMSLGIQTPSGQTVPLRNVATIISSSGPSVISRLNRQTQIGIGANAVGRLPAQVAADMRERLNQLRLPSNVTVRFGGQVQQTQDALNTLMGSLALSVLFMYMVLASQFGSFTQPIVLMLALPLAIIGAFGALIITGTPADMTAVIGLILLMGLAVKNSILLVDFANRLRAQGMTRTEALLIAGPTRLRPILMTTSALILGMTPVALARGAGGSFRAPMAIAVIGGLITSTLLTLLIVPVFYDVLIAAQEKLLRRPAKVAQPAATPAAE
ncbi:MAG: efflux RND transporter permease subunit [Chloroflexi bacterium]|nr:efflux RND transporter permease subunit [Chloroflexota bacterium]